MRELRKLAYIFTICFFIILVAASEIMKKNDYPSPEYRDFEKAWEAAIGTGQHKMFDGYLWIVTLKELKGSSFRYAFGVLQGKKGFFALNREGECLAKFFDMDSSSRIMSKSGIEEIVVDIEENYIYKALYSR